MTQVIITFSIIGLIFLINYLMFVRRNNLTPNKFEYENLKLYKDIFYEENESDVQNFKSKIN